jgi:predicted membrane GTPase involved in stress response
MIVTIRTENILDESGDLNAWESISGINIICASWPKWMSEDPDSVSQQIIVRYNAVFNEVPSDEPGQLGGIGKLFMTQPFQFSEVQARAFSIVCHLDDNGLAGQNYRYTMRGMEAGLKTIVDDGLTINELKKKEAMTSLRWDITAIMGMDTSDLWDELIQTLESVLQNTQSRIRPIVRAPLMATGSPEDCRNILRIMQASQARIALYSWPRWVVDMKATVLKFPGMFREIPELAREELRLVANGY